jgi:hypothetical protein
MLLYSEKHQDSHKSRSWQLVEVGEMFLAKVMDTKMSMKHGDLVIQKVVFAKNQFTEEAFHQEVGVMIMLSKYPYSA